MVNYGRGLVSRHDGHGVLELVFRVGVLVKVRRLFRFASVRVLRMRDQIVVDHVRYHNQLAICIVSGEVVREHIHIEAQLVLQRAVHVNFSVADGFLGDLGDGAELWRHLVFVDLGLLFLVKIAEPRVSTAALATRHGVAAQQIRKNLFARLSVIFLEGVPLHLSFIPGE